MGCLEKVLNEAESKTRNKTMAMVFEAQVRRNPTKVGLVCGNKSFTYEEMNAKANQVAKLIRFKVQIPRDAVIALVFERSELIIFGILGVWKAGGAYVAIDPKNPPERTSYLFESSNPVLTLTNSASEPMIPPVTCPIINLSKIVPVMESDFINDLNFEIHGEDLALVVYTSGTSGKPKGVMIEQKSLVNQCLDYPLRYPNLTKDEVVIQLFNYGFNAFLEPVTLALSQGLSLVLVPFELLLEPTALVSYFIKNGVTHIDGTPSLISQYNLSALTTLKRIAVGGESLTKAHRSTLLKNNPNAHLYNIYGNTEGTLCTLTTDATTSDSFAFTREVVNKRVYILDSNLKPVPIGEVGEICFTGPGVTRGYVNSEDLTSQKYIRNPFQTQDEKESGSYERMYLTGDMGLVLPSGGIQWAGRRDFQVRIRGMRVELGEIEHVLASYPGITKTAVICIEKIEGNQLIGFFMSESDPSDGKSFVERLKHFLFRSLPEYMVPSRLVQLQNFPLTTNGKIDRRELTAQASSSTFEVQEQGCDASLTPQEKIICEIWEEVLSLPPNSVTKSSNFFSLGGNSLLSIKVVNIILERLGIQLNPSTIVENGGSFLSYLEASDENSAKSKYPPIPKRDVVDAPLSTSQERIWASRDSPYHHITFEFEIIEGNGFKTASFISRISEIINRHEILRTIYPSTRFGIKVEKILAEGTPFVIESNLVSNETRREALKLFAMEPFDLSTDFPLRLGIFESSQKTVVLLVLHAIAMDSVSQNIFLEELMNPITQKPEVQYGDFATFQRNYIPGEDGNQVVEYWKKWLKVRREIPIERKFGIEILENLELNLDTTLSNSLRHVAQSIGVSLYALLLAGYFIMLQKRNPLNSEISVGTFISTRDHPGLHRILGNFTNLVPISVKLKPETSTKEFIQMVAALVQTAKLNQHFPLDALVSAAGGMRSFLKLNHFKYMFDAATYSTNTTTFLIDGWKWKLRRHEENSYILPGTQLFTKVDTSREQLKVWMYGEKINLNEIGATFLSILDYFCQNVC